MSFTMSQVAFDGDLAFLFGGKERGMKKFLQCVILLVLSSILVGNAYGRKIKVPKDYPTIQAAIDAASEGDIVEVSDGIYTGSGNKNLDFGGKDITLRSKNGPENCIIGKSGHTDGLHFYFHNGESKNAVVDGFTLRGYSIDTLGGIYILDSSPTIINLIIEDNHKQNGGGIYISNSSTIISDCIIRDNYGDTISGWGGGIYLSNSSVTMTNCVVENNVAGLAGGIYCRDSHLTLSDSTIIANSASEDYVGGIYLHSSTATIKNCRFSENQGSFYDSSGGAICMSGSDATITNSIFSGNIASVSGGRGGAIGINSSTATITNCTFTGNRTTEYLDGDGIEWDVGGAISIAYNSTAIITNSILWGDTAIADSEIWIDDTSSAAVYNCIIDQDGYAGANGNKREDPLFVDPGYWDDNGTPTDPEDDIWVEGDYHLTADSPAIDAGTKDAPELPKFDFEGDPRKKGGFPDIGADEFKK
jgi:parallel beta-helix repeat protein